MKLLIYDNSSAQWVAEYGHTSETLDAKSFDTADEARTFCEQRADLLHHRISILGFQNTEVILKHKGVTKRLAKMDVLLL